MRISKQKMQRYNQKWNQANKVQIHISMFYTCDPDSSPALITAEALSF